MNQKITLSINTKTVRTVRLYAAMEGLKLSEVYEMAVTKYLAERTGPELSRAIFPTQDE